MGGFGRYLLRESVIDKPGLLLWFPGSSKHITRRQFLILGDAGFPPESSLAPPSANFALPMGGVGFP